MTSACLSFWNDTIRSTSFEHAYLTQQCEQSRVFEFFEQRWRARGCSGTIFIAFRSVESQLEIASSETFCFTTFSILSLSLPLPLSLSLSLLSLLCLYSLNRFFTLFPSNSFSQRTSSQSSGSDRVENWDYPIHAAKLLMRSIAFHPSTKVRLNQSSYHCRSDGISGKDKRNSLPSLVQMFYLMFGTPRKLQIFRKTFS